MDDRNTAGTAILLDPEQTDKLLSRFNVPTVPQRVVYSPEPDDAVRAAEEFGYPVVLKAFTPTLVHRSDVGGVRMFLHDDHQVARAAMSIQERVPDLIGYLLQTQAPGGHELMIACSRAAGFGPVLQVGLGGGWSELVGDISARIAPLDRPVAREMIDELVGAPLLYGRHGARKADIDALVEMLVNVSRLVVETPEVTQIDINPAIAGTHEVVVVDARVFWDSTRSIGNATPPEPADETLNALGHLLSPRSIAVVGSMADADAPGRQVLESLRAHGFAGDVFPIDPEVNEVTGLRAYPTPDALPAVPDLACIAVPQGRVADTVRSCGEIGVAAAILYLAVDDETASAVRQAAAATGIRVCGPGSAGVVNAVSGLNAAGDSVPSHVGVPAGEIAFLTQSGALGSWMLGQSLATGAGFSHWVDTGEEADLTLSDYLEYLAGSADTRAIAIYLETLRAPQAFMHAAERARDAGKPVVVYKSGVTGPGRPEARRDYAIEAAFRSAGVARVPDLQTLADASLALAWQPIPHGRGVGVVSSSSGARNAIADECARSGLTLPALEEETRERIREIDPPVRPSQNPVDIRHQMAHDPAVMRELTNALLRDRGINSLVLVVPPMSDVSEERLVREIERAVRGAGKPVLITRPGAGTQTAEDTRPYQSARLPTFPTPDRAIRTLRALRAMVDIGEGRKRSS